MKPLTALLRFVVLSNFKVTQHFYKQRTPGIETGRHLENRTPWLMGHPRCYTRIGKWSKMKTVTKHKFNFESLNSNVNSVKHGGIKLLNMLQVFDIHVC